LATALATPSLGAGNTPLPDETATPAILSKRVPPLFPAKAIERGQEGWVDVRFSITPEGTTSAVRIVAEYPRHVFSRSAINAVAKWTYKPRQEGGSAMPQGNNQAVLSFALNDSSAIREENAPKFTAARAALDARDWPATTKAAAAIAETESLNLFELASLEEIKGRLAYGEQRFAEAADCFSRALEITAHFSPDTRDALTALLVRAKLYSGDTAAAVTAFDHWNPPPRDDIRDLRRAVETARAGLSAHRAASP
jgi:TonB family protein